MEEQNSMKINQLPSKTWYWLGLNDTKVKWAAGAPCEICAEEPSADDEITGFPEAMNTGAGKETDVLFAPEQTKNWNVSAKEGQTKQVTLSIGQGKETVSSGKIRAVAEEGASLTVFEVFEPAQAAGQLAVRTELYAKKNSRIRLVQVMMRGEGQELLNDVGCICEENGALDLLQVVVGKGDVYDGIWTELQKDHASLQAEIGYLLQNQQKFDVNLNVRHFGKVTESTIQADGTLMDAAEKIFRGTIDFVRGSADSVGAETEQVLLLGDDVVNKTIPVILCAEENVQGSHGAAIGELDEETLFYFGARGMDRTQAENTMARAKLEAKIQKIGDADIEQKVKTQLAEVLDRDNREHQKKFPASAANGHDLSGQRGDGTAPVMRSCCSTGILRTEKCKSSARILSFKPGGDGELSGGKKDRTGVYSCRRAGGDYFYPEYNGKPEPCGIQLWPELFKGRRRDRCNNHGASQQSASVADGVAYDWGKAPLSGMYQ